MTPFSTRTDLVADVEGLNEGNDLVRVSILFSTDEGPARAFKHLLAVDLDEANANELLGELSIALTKLRKFREAHG